MYIELTS